MQRPTIILGPPGTGKTTRLLEIMEDEMKSQVDPRRIAFCSFTKKAAGEAITRAKDKFGYENEDLPYFQTLHSMAYRQIGLKRNSVMQPSDYRVIGDHLGLQFSWKNFDEEGVPSEHYLGDRYTFLDGLSKARMQPAEEIWHEIADEELNWWEYRRFCRVLQEYKDKKKKTDFNDMLMQDGGPVDVEVAIIDEAQDLSALQWAFVRRSFPHAKRIYIAGDDDQAIFAWSGAAVDYFVDLEGDRVTLEQSYRIPKAVHRLAEGITQQINHRSEKVYLPQDREGSIEWHNRLESIDISKGTWYLLARNIYHLSPMVAWIREKGVPYIYRNKPSINPEHIHAIQAWETARKGQPITSYQKEIIAKYQKTLCSTNRIWHEALNGLSFSDREYYISLLRAGESLTKTPRVHINTIHGVKGGEADNVVLMTDVTLKTKIGMDHDPDSEHRVFYVAVTRAKENLHLMVATSGTFYNL